MFNTRVSKAIAQSLAGTLYQVGVFDAGDDAEVRCWGERI
jgi:hypothetical protein